VRGMNDTDKKLILEWCGFVYDHWGDDLFLVYPDKESVNAEEPELDMNFYFKYAVPKLHTLDNFHVLNYQYIGFAQDVKLLRHGWSIIFRQGDDYYASGDDPAEAFGEALLKLIKGI